MAALKDECVECDWPTSEECMFCGDHVCDDCIDIHYASEHPEEI